MFQRNSVALVQVARMFRGFIAPPFALESRLEIMPEAHDWIPTKVGSPSCCRLRPDGRSEVLWASDECGVLPRLILGFWKPWRKFARALSLSPFGRRETGDGRGGIAEHVLGLCVRCDCVLLG